MVGADENQERSAFLTAVVDWRLDSLRSQRKLRAGFVGGRSGQDCGLVVLAPGGVFGAQLAVCGSREFAARPFVQRPVSGGSKVVGLVGCWRCRSLTKCSSRPRNSLFVSTQLCRRGGLTQR